MFSGPEFFRSRLTLLARTQDRERSQRHRVPLQHSQRGQGEVTETTIQLQYSQRGQGGVGETPVQLQHSHRGQGEVTETPVLLQHGHRAERERERGHRELIIQRSKIRNIEIMYIINRSRQGFVQLSYTAWLLFIIFPIAFTNAVN